jgi:hypothetical protein
MKLFSLGLLVGVATILFPLFISWYESGWVSIYTSPKYDFGMIPDMNGAVALVTGSNTGA